MTMRLFCLACCAVLFASGCAGKRLSDLGTSTSLATQNGLPPGVVLDAPRRGDAAIDGLFPSVPGDRTCCWIATRARLLARKVAPAKYLDLTIYVPDYPFFERRPQSLAVTIESGDAQQRCCFPPGTHTLRFELPAPVQVKEGTLRVLIRSRFPFVPAAEGVNADTRSLGVVVSRIDFRS